MALVPTIKVCSTNSCSGISITDTTGVYDASTNLTGWSVSDADPNINPTDTNFAVSVTIDGGTAIPITSQVPENVVGNFTYDTIDIDLTDGWHTIVYTVTSDTATTSVTVKIFTYCKIKCCIFNKMLEMKEYDPCKDTSTLLKYMHLWNLYNAMIYEANGCNANNATTTLTRLQTLCGVTVDCRCS